MGGKDSFDTREPLVWRNGNDISGNGDTKCGNFGNSDHEKNEAKNDVRSSLSIKFMLIACLVHGFNEKIFYSILFYEGFEKKDLILLKTEGMLFFQHIIGCIGFTVWGLGYRCFDVLLVLSTSFFIWGLASLFQTFSHSIWTISLCRLLVSFSQSSLEPLIQVLAEKVYFKRSDMVKLFGLYYFYKAIGGFLGFSVVSLVNLRGNPLHFSTNYSKIFIFSGIISIIVSSANVSLATSFSYKRSRRYLIEDDTNVDVSCCKDKDVGGRNGSYFSEIEVDEDNSGTSSRNGGGERQENLSFYSSLNEGDSNAKKTSINSKFVVICLFPVCLIGVLMLVVREIYGLIQINSSFYINNTYYEKQNSIFDEYGKLSFNVTYYTLRCLVYLLGAALGSLIFGILYGKLYGIYKGRTHSSNERTSFSFGAGGYRHFYFTLVLLGAALQFLLFVFLNSNRVFPNIQGLISNKESDYSEILQFYAHLIEVFLTGFTLTIIVDLIIRSEILFISGERSSVAFYGIYLTLSGVLSNSSFYKYIKAFKINKDDFLILSNNIKINMFPTIFHNPMKVLLSTSVIRDIYGLKKANSFEKVQVTHIDISIYTISLYTTISAVVAWLFVILVALKARNVTGICGNEVVKVRSDE
ncbi:hypothetical protein FG386_000348 [Cryptosporidium ryanae]|uniref:uncharacterized protein n=1 Tax=Cryptosporidium ryanae TaxID=515981 RepID=UPI00351A0F99|nr:hypothetical protein FG386_000348 [Cryptosporidium ryanae]